MTNHGTVTDAALATLKQANLTLDGTGTVSLGQITTLSGGTVTASGGTIALAGLTVADGSSFLVSGGASLTVAALSSYAGPINVTATWEATGTNSLLSFTKLAAITEDTGSYSSHTDRGALGWRRRAGRACDDQRRPGRTGKRWKRQQAQCSFTDECNRQSLPAVSIDAAGIEQR